MKKLCTSFVVGMLFALTAHAQANKVTVFPNPVKAGSLITVSENTGDVRTRTIYLLDATGARLAQTKAITSNTINLPVPSELRSGTYIIRIESPDAEPVVCKVIVTK